jgi:hypothetical protein
MGDGPPSLRHLRITAEGGSPRSEIELLQITAEGGSPRFKTSNARVSPNPPPRYSGEGLGEGFLNKHLGMKFVQPASLTIE